MASPPGEKGVPGIGGFPGTAGRKGFKGDQGPFGSRGPDGISGKKGMIKILRILPESNGKMTKIITLQQVLMQRHPMSGHTVDAIHLL